MEKPTKLNLESSEKEIIEACQNIDQLNWASSEAKNLYLTYLMGLLDLQQQKRLFKEQKRSNGKLVFATWILAIATTALVMVDLIFSFIRR